eukprot:GILK01010266.1.p1 GENE.GILK01010266.1~~GILK01010266.1.p1  ORF type:complete len:403 (+),score=81.23 GILK01010266.1:50-1258(+)
MDVFVFKVTPQIENVAMEELTELGLTEATQVGPGLLLVRSCLPLESCKLPHSVESIFAYVGEIQELPAEKDSAILKMEEEPQQFDWSTAIALWRRFYPNNFSMAMPLTFRSSAERTGIHTFKSPDVEAAIGYAFQTATAQDKFKVSLKKFDIEVFSFAFENRVLIGLSLRRDIGFAKNRIWSELGLETPRTALKPSLAYCLARMARIQPGEVVLDPMGGAGTICIEGAFSWNRSYFVTGDVETVSASLASAIVASNNVQSNTTVALWDAKRMPLRDRCVDVIICDLPFGERHGSHVNNSRLYPKALSELKRVLRDSGRCYLMTIEHKLMNNLLNHQLWKPEPFYRWRLESRIPVNVGGYQAYIYHLTKELVTEVGPMPLPSEAKKKWSKKKKSTPAEDRTEQ